MILPSDEGDRHRVYRNKIRQCAASRDERRTRNSMLRDWYLYGTDRGEMSVYNKLAEHVETSDAFLYASESTRFGISLPPEHGDEFLDEQEAWREELHRLWQTGIGAAVGFAVTWGHVWPSAVTKTIISGGVACVEPLQDPSDFGVLEEDGSLTLDKQEAMVHWYCVGLPTFERDLRKLDHLSAKQRDEIMARAETIASPRPTSAGLSLGSATERLLIASSSPSLVGNVQNMNAMPLAVPRVDEPVVELAELWIKDDANHDYRVATNFLADETIINDMVNPHSAYEHGRWVRGGHPFDILVLTEVAGYLWGLSTVAVLSGLQAWRERRMWQIDELLKRQLDPPFFYKGFSGIRDEQNKAMRRSGGFITNPMPNAEVIPLAPQMPADAFAELDAIDRMFANRGGLPQLLQGQGEAGLRAGNQAGVLATLGSARLRKKAMRVEAFCSSIATKVVRLERLNSGKRLRKPDGEEFFASQIPASVSAEVSAHSASPLYAEQIVQKVIAIKTVAPSALSDEQVIDLVDLPMSESLKTSARRRGKAQAEMAKAQIEGETKKVGAEAEKDLAQARKADADARKP